MKIVKMEEIKNSNQKKHFYEYVHPSTINEVIYPHCPSDGGMLIYARDHKEAFKLAMRYVYEGKKMGSFNGTYKGEKYENIKCIM